MFVKLNEFQSDFVLYFTWLTVARDLSKVSIVITFLLKWGHTAFNISTFISFEWFFQEILKWTSKLKNVITLASWLYN